MNLYLLFVAKAVTLESSLTAYLQIGIGTVLTAFERVAVVSNKVILLIVCDNLQMLEYFVADQRHHYLQSTLLNSKPTLICNLCSIT